MPKAPARREALPLEALSADALQREVEAEGREEAEEGAVVEPPKGPEKEEWTFPFECRDSRGVLWEGTFTDLILKGRRQNRAVEILQARLAQGTPYDVLDHHARDMNHIQAHMQISLIDRPKWAKILDELEDEVLVALWRKVEEHEECYFRPGTAQAPSTGEAP